MKHRYFPVVFLFFMCGFCGILFSQTSIQALLQEGDAFFEKKNYSAAINKYKEALVIYPASASANYKLAYTYYTLHDYTLSEHYTNIGIRQNDPDTDPLFCDLRATIYLETDRVTQAIDFAKKSLKTYPDRIALQFCLGLAYHKLGDYKNAEKYTLQVLTQDPTHKTAHLLSGYLSEAQNNNVQAALSFYYFLMLEPDSERSAPTFERLLQNLGLTPLPVAKEGDTPKILQPKDGLFKKTAKMLPVFYAQTQIENHRKDDAFYCFETVTRNLFKYLYLDDVSKETSYWRTFYVPFFFAIYQNNLHTTFCHYIRYQAYISSYQWVNEHKEEVNSMADFLNDHLNNKK